LACGADREVENVLNLGESSIKGGVEKLPLSGEFSTAKPLFSSSLSRSRNLI
jgi:hypothetical protein